MAEFDLLVRGDLLWPGPGSVETTRAAVAIQGGRVAWLGSPAEVPGPARRVIGGPGRLIMPGLVNGHTHLAMTLFRGLADDLPLMDWLQNHIWPAEAAQVNEDMTYWAGLLGCAEAIRAGTTSLADGYFCQKGTLRALAQAGLRAVVAQGIIDFPAPGVPDPSRNLAVAEEFLTWSQGLSPLLRPALFCHAPYTCGPETLAGAKRLADKHDTWVFTHLSETAAEPGLIQDKYGLSPTEYLDQTGFLDDRTVLIHGDHLGEPELDLIARRGSALVTCPESNMKLASGRARVGRWLNRGLRVGLGTDGPASNNDLNLFGEMGSLARWFKASLADPTVLPAETVLALATAGGAAALGWAGLGRIEVGGPADLITLDLTEPHLLPLHHLPAQLVYSAHGGEVRESVVAGRVLMNNGQLTTVDLDEVRARVAELHQ